MKTVDRCIFVQICIRNVQTGNTLDDVQFSHSFNDLAIIIEMRQADVDVFTFTAGKFITKLYVFARSHSRKVKRKSIENLARKSDGVQPRWGCTSRECGTEANGKRVKVIARDKDGERTARLEGRRITTSDGRDEVAACTMLERKTRKLNWQAQVAFKPDYPSLVLNYLLQEFPSLAHSVSVTLAYIHTYTYSLARSLHLSPCLSLSFFLEKTPWRGSYREFLFAGEQCYKIAPNTEWSVACSTNETNERTKAANE